MGIYLNPGTIEFQESINSEIYVDKTMLIERTNAALRTKQKYMCISRPRRFGKSMAADMLAAYYGKDNDSAALFDGLEISHAETFSTRDDVLTLLVHLGYLTYDVEKESVRIPNKEVVKKYLQALSEYQGNLILAGINYDKKTKKHTCLIEKVNYNLR